MVGLLIGTIMKKKFKITDEQKVVLYKIASKMSDNDYSAKYIVDAVDLASRYRYIYDLMIIWERDEALVIASLAEAQRCISFLKKIGAEIS
jgi:hypothetical protein